MKLWLQDNDSELYSTNNEGKSDVVERFIRTLKNKTYKYMTSIFKNAYIDKLADIVNKYNNTYHSIIKTKPVGVNPSTYIYFNKESNKKKAKFEVDDHVRTSKYKNIFAKDYVPNWSEEVLVSKKDIMSDLNGERIIGRFYEKEFQKTNQQDFGVEKLIKRKDEKF